MDYKKYIDKVVKDFVNKPLKKILYDLELLPEHIGDNDPEKWLIMQVIIGLYYKNNKE